VDLADEIHGISSREVEQEIELRGQYRGREVVLHGYHVQPPVVDSDDVSDGQFPGGDSHRGLAAKSDRCPLADKCARRGELAR
jgi:hypothetical protein